MKTKETKKIKKANLFFGAVVVAFLIFLAAGCGKAENTDVVIPSDLSISASELDVEYEDIAIEEDPALLVNPEAAEPDEENEEDTDSGNKTPRFKYYIKVNRQANCITVYTYDDNGEYTIPVKAMACSVGLNNRTPKGTFKTSSKYRWHNLKGGVQGQYCTRITGSILFHSVPYFYRDNSALMTDYYNMLGRAASAGCIRLTCADAKWLYENCASGTTVTIYDSGNPGPLGKPSTIRIAADNPYKFWDPTDTSEVNPWILAEPIISGVKDLVVERGDAVDYYGSVYVEDYLGNVVTPTVSPTVDTMVCGEYTITYTATTANGKTKTQTAKVTVKDTKAPSIKWNGNTVTINDTDSNETVIGKVKSVLSATDAGVALNNSGIIVDISKVKDGVCTAYASDAYGNSSSTITVKINYVITLPENPNPEQPENPNPEQPENPDPEQPENPEPENPEPENPDPEQPDPEQPVNLDPGQPETPGNLEESTIDEAIINEELPLAA